MYYLFALVLIYPLRHKILNVFLDCCRTRDNSYIISPEQLSDNLNYYKYTVDNISYIKCDNDNIKITSEYSDIIIKKIEFNVNIGTEPTIGEILNDIKPFAGYYGNFHTNDQVFDISKIINYSDKFQYMKCIKKIIIENEQFECTVIE